MAIKKILLYPNPLLLRESTKIEKFDDETLILISDVDEIPNPNKIKEFLETKSKYGVFEQLFFYYKLNFLNITNKFWHGSKICKKKDF